MKKTLIILLTVSISLNLYLAYKVFYDNKINDSRASIGTYQAQDLWLEGLEDSPYTFIFDEDKATFHSSSKKVKLEGTYQIDQDNNILNLKMNDNRIYSLDIKGESSITFPFYIEETNRIIQIKMKKVSDLPTYTGFQD